MNKGLQEQNTLSQKDLQDLLAEYDPEAGTRRLSGIVNKLITAFAVSFSLFHIYTAFIGGLSSQLQRSIHLAFVLGLIFLLFPFSKKKIGETKIPIIDVILAFVGIFVGLYWLLFFDDLVSRIGMPTTLDLIVGALAILLVLEGSRRVVGIPITLIVSVFLLYALFGQYFPSFLRHGGISFERLFSHMYFTTEGILGTPLAVSATFIFLFVLFGAILDKTGVGDYFNDLALVIAGRASGGPAKVTIFSSALQGTISGSSVANVVTSGAFTIPLMKKLGYRKEFAGAVEASSSTGGQIMPPVMGAAAFLMAEFTGIPYWEIVKAAAIPAVLYFVGIWIMTHYEAKRLGLRGLTKEELPSVKYVLKKLYLLVPIVSIIYLLSTGMSPMRAALYGLFVAIVTGFIQPGEKRLTIKGLIEALETGARAALGVAVACAAAGMIVGVIVLTGIGLKFANGLIDLAGGQVFITLIMTMVASLILGMGVPTTANYVITSTIAAPVLVELGFPLLAAHMFVFYFGIVADITPPVALAAFAASGIGQSDPLKTGVESTRLAIAAFIIPYIFVFSPQMLLIDTDWVGATLIMISSTIGMIGVGAGMIGYWVKPIPILLRGVLVIAGILLVVPELISSIVGAVLMVGIFMYQKFIQRGPDLGISKGSQDLSN
ncbi:C4-dicarboxylate ABC transporter [Bacillus canaveralius]|uniref:C4-dicarboxylate ABC transporter n=1 Tax=Bacillus canaveralius TaxID=1403243 RepID=A0A2N5GH95_9BACI|nr:TRAP transporter permease [Bacillus canaveralius]PLR80127.1 C4-dicarboxylate ABC transporter [Bacillus canaveralius]PLR91651.1 C4-dicarboxylate ABC transporter [Bacillus canaveralius]RSK57582.1 TRAP transporter permease [Bacillus canaveralius]